MEGAVAAAAVVAALGGAGGSGQVDAGDLEAVEEEAGAFGVDFVGGDAVLGEREVELGLAGAAAARVFDRAASGVVVVTKFFLAEAWAGAAVSVGEDVAALEASGLVWHGVDPYPYLNVAKYSK